MPRSWHFRIEDILSAITKIQRYTDGLDQDSFQADQKTVDAVLRNLEVIGEAAGHIPQDVADRHPDVPWQQMKALRNILAHEYFGIDSKIVWRTIQMELPPLIPALLGILDEI